MTKTKLRLTGLAAIIVTLVADQASKQAILELFADPASSRRHVEIITGLFDLVLWWNRGVSFGMLGHLQESAPLILTALASVVCLALLAWLWRSARLLPALAIGMVVGGAIGNVIDRLRFGAVVDFLYLYHGDWYWPAFNVADSAICVGVGLLLFDSLTNEKKSSKQEGSIAA